MSDNHAGYQQHAMDGDAAAKTMDKGASAALPNTEFGDGIYEASKPRAEPAGDKATGAGTVCLNPSYILSHILRASRFMFHTQHFVLELLLWTVALGLLLILICGVS